MALYESSLLSIAKPYHWIFGFFGLVNPVWILSSHRYHYSSWFVYIFHGYFILHSLLLMGLSILITYYNNALIRYVVSKLSLDNITAVLGIGINVTVLLVQFVVHVHAILNSDAVRRLFSDIACLEQQIRWHCKNNAPAGADVGDAVASERCWASTIRWRVASVSGLWLLALLLLMPFVNYHLISRWMSFGKRVVTSFYLLLVQVKGVEFCVTAQFLYELLRLLHQKLQLLQHEFLVLRRDDQQFALRRLVFQAQLQENRRLLAAVWNLLNSVEYYFGIPMLLLFLYNGLHITQTIHWAYIQFQLDELDIRLYRIVMIVLVINNLFMPCYLSQRCINMYNQFGPSLHKFKFPIGDVNLCFNLQEYSLPLLHQRMIFTCGGFFDINLKYFGAIILTITTYIIILIQLKLQTEKESKKFLFFDIS